MSQSVSTVPPVRTFPGALYQASQGGTASDAAPAPTSAPIRAKSRIVRVVLIQHRLVRPQARRDPAPFLPPGSPVRSRTVRCPWLTVCRVPDDLAGVTSIGFEVPARDAGVDPAGLRRVWAAVERLYASGMHPAIQLCVRRLGQPVLDRAIGHAW